MKKIAFITYDGFALWQVALLQKFLKQEGWAIDTFSLHGGIVQSDGGLEIVSTTLEKADPLTYDLLMMAGGDITDDLLTNETLKLFIQQFNGIIAASCASSIIVASAGLLDCQYTTMPHLNEQFHDYYVDGTYVDSDICVTERIITSRGYAHYDLMIAVLEKLNITTNKPKLKQLALKLAKNQ
ncbi:putative intracellular protease/amidase [Salirhabdus euzebyi]|uniref:Putative intracellular protease/amidase n=1 Tax=Salirhabdus euzebyi TaxID=394506 RepID=A0A841PY20_9BACI|nr:DJ-1/PfpI family protein [Salirhabdus euzebyi]MBB6452466.1 putative intracellular protease/amidase [Salirhabdus euzebyi]